MVGIDLTPPREIRRQKTQYVVGASTKITVFMFLVVVGLSAYLFYKTQTYKSRISVVENKRAELVLQRGALKEVEDYAKRLSGKYFLLGRYLESRTKYSSVVTELISRVPAGITFESISLDSGGKRSKVSGLSSDIVQVSAFMSKLTKEGNASTESSQVLTGKKAFSDVRLDTLSVDESKKVEYEISFIVNEENFQK